MGCLPTQDGLPSDPTGSAPPNTMPTLSVEGAACLGPWGRRAQHLSLHPICLPSRCTRPSTSPSLPWPTPRAVCSISAAVPFGNYSARSAFTSCPCYRCQSPCKITSFWNQRVFCTENQSVGTKAPDLTAALRGGLCGGKPLGDKGQTRRAPPTAPGGRTDPAEPPGHFGRERVIQVLSASQGC